MTQAVSLGPPVRTTCHCNDFTASNWEYIILLSNGLNSQPLLVFTHMSCDILGQFVLFLGKCLTILLDRLRWNIMCEILIMENELQVCVTFKNTQTNTRIHIHTYIQTDRYTYDEANDEVNICL